MKCHHWKTPLITITFFPSQVWPIPNSDHPAARPRSCTANILKHFLLWGNDSFSSWDSWKWPRVYILWMAILLSPCIYLWIFSFGLGTALSQVSYALVANWNPSPGKHSFSPRFRYLYAFYWKNVGALNDDFFGFILLVTNPLLIAYGALFASLAFEYWEIPIYSTCTGIPPEVQSILNLILKVCGKSKKKMKKVCVILSNIKIDNKSHLITNQNEVVICYCTQYNKCL